jgi:hypothetical protein
MRVRRKDGRELFRQLDIGPGFPGNPLTGDDHKKRFRDCLNFAKKKIGEEKATQIVSAIENLEKIDDVRNFIQLFST